MKDETKHIVAKETYFFFKYFLIGLIPFTIIFIIIVCGVFQYYHDIELLFLYGSPFITILIAYISRIYQWVMKWK